MHFTSARLTGILDTFPRRKILVIGDLMLDEFLWGKVTRISPEAPVPVVDIQRRASYPAGRPTCRVTSPASARRRDWPESLARTCRASKLVQLLSSGRIATGSIRKTALRPTTHKTRVCAITRQLHDPSRNRGPAADRPRGRGIARARSIPTAGNGFSPGSARKFPRTTR